VKEKRKLILYASGIENAANVAIAATLARMCRSREVLFDIYYHSYHEGVHFPGGDCRLRRIGEMTGGTVSGDHHFEQLYLLLLNFDVQVVCSGETLFDRYIRCLGIPVLCRSKRIGEIYQKVAEHLGLRWSDEIVMVGTFPDADLRGLENYLYPEIIYRDVLAVPDRIAREDLEGICREEGKLLCFYVREEKLERLRAAGFRVEIGDWVRDGDDYGTITKRIASRWYDKAKGWMIGDPVLVGHWIPTACEEDIVSVYDTPQEKIVSELSEEIRAKSPVVYGRQYSDRDFFELSKRDACLQVIDPCRPAFQALKHAEYTPEPCGRAAEVYEPEYSDQELEQFAQEGRILVSLMFWSGMIRETQTLPNLMDLIAITRLKCGLVVTAQTYDYAMSSPFELINIPLDWGGVHPLVEPVLGLGKNDFHYRTRYHEGLFDFLPSLRCAKMLNYEIKMRFSKDAVERNGEYNVRSEAFSVTTRLFDKFYQAALDNGSLPIIILFPNQQDQDTYRRKRTTRYRSLVEEFDRKAYLYIDLLKGFQNRTKVHDAEEALFSKAGHYSPLGNAVVAETIESYMTANGLASEVKIKEVLRKEQRIRLEFSK
jgi:hypothetical protein